MIISGGIIGGALPSITRTDTGNYNTTAVNPITFSSRSLGAAGRRHIAVTIGCVTAVNVTGVTIAGVTATLVASTSVLTVKSLIYIASVPTGTTGNVVVTFSGNSTNAFIGVYALYNLRSATPVDTATDAVNGGVGSYTLNLDANISSRGVVVSGIQGAGITIGPTAVGLINEVTINANPLAARSADYTATAAETPRTMGWTVNSDTAACLATF